MKQFITFLALIFSYMLCGAQATSLTVDNQTPGWLSSKINYGDQQTVKNLTVTGYINQADLSFIGDLMSKHNLSGHLNLTDAEVVDTKFSNPPTSSGTLTMFQLSQTVSINRFSIPKSMSYISPYLLARVQADTLDYGSERCNVLTELLVTNRAYGTTICPKVLILREGVTKIKKLGTDEGNEKKLESIIIPQTVDSIGDNAFEQCSNLIDINLPNNIHTIGRMAFAKTSVCPDSLYLPTSLKTYNTSSFPIKNGQVIVLGNEVTNFNNSSWSLKKTTNVTYIINRTTPPTFTKGESGNSYSDGQELSGCTLYVPKEGYSMYADPKYNSVGGPGGFWSGWSNPYSHAKLKTIHIPVEGILINNTSTTLNVGNYIYLIANVVPSNADNASISWASSNPNVASVNSSGLVTAMSSGIATIFAYSSENSDIYATCEVTVHQPLESITLNSKNITLNAGQTYDGLSLTYYPATADNKNVTWQSSNAEILTVNVTGEITAIKGGDAKVIVISVENDNIKDECTVTVLQPTTGITLDKSEIEIIEDESIQLIATVLPENASNKSVNWTSSDISVAMVSPNGTVYAIKPGQATIMATTVDGGFVALCKILVTDKKVIPVSEIILDPTEIEGIENGTATIKALIIPDNATNKQLRWYSSNDDVAMVNDGVVKFVKKGTAIISAEAIDGSNVKSECVVVISESSGIESIIEDKNTYVKIFNLSGHLIYQGIYAEANIMPGKYIVLCNSKSFKAIID